MSFNGNYKLGKKIKSHKVILGNMTYLSILQLFLIIAPLITFPYLVRVLGRELYGVILTAQMLANYAAVFIDFGSNNVCAKHISINRNDKNKMSEIISSVLISRFFIWVGVFFIYYLIVLLVPSYREYTLLFLLSYGMTCNELLFPQFFFQGIEKMRYITIISIITKLIFILLIFVVVREKDDYLWVPVLYTIGYFSGGLYALYVVFKHEKCSFVIPSFETIIYYVKDSFPIFASDIICTIKDRINYLLVGAYAGMSNVVIFDLGLKINGLLSKPTSIVSVSLFPRFAKNRDKKKIKTVVLLSLGISVVLVALVNIFMVDIVSMILGDPNIELLPISIFTIAPLLLSVSVIIYNDYFVAFGLNKYALYSMIITTIVYIVFLLFFLFGHCLNSIYSFIIISLCSYFTEFIYRIYIYLRK